MSRWIIMATNRACACLSHRAASLEGQTGFSCACDLRRGFSGFRETPDPDFLDPARWVQRARKCVRDRTDDGRHRAAAAWAP